MNPAGARMDRLYALVLRGLAELGATPASRARLGLSLGRAALTLAELNRASAGTAIGEADRDPRLAVVDRGER